MLITGAYAIFSLHRLELLGAKDRNYCSIVMLTKGWRRELLQLDRRHYFINAASFLLTNAKSAHQVRQPFVS